MLFTKFLAGAAIVAAPLSLVSAQSAAPADSGNHGHLREWLAGSGAATGAAFFLAFTNSGHGDLAGSGNSAAHAPITDPTGPSVPISVLTPSPTGGSTPPSNPPPPNPPHDTATVTLPPGNSPAAVGNSSPPPSDTPPPPTYDAPLPPTDNAPPPHETLSLTTESSTVPEPGTLALTATGIIGLLPLIRRRRRRLR